MNPRFAAESINGPLQTRVRKNSELQGEDTPEVQSQIAEQFSKQSGVIVNLRHNVELLGSRLNDVMRPPMMGDDNCESMPRSNNIAPMAVLVENNNDSLSAVNDMLVDLLQRLEL